MKKVLFLLFLLSGLVLVSSCSKEENLAEELEVTINGQELTFNTIIVDRQGSIDERYYSAVINSNTSRIITFYANVGDDGENAVQNFTYTIRGRIYKQMQSSDMFIGDVRINNNARFAMDFSGTLSSYDAETDSYDSIVLSDGRMDVEY
ncbi:MAG: hypothetical protein AAFX55_17025 [Bacteroidota bacterium]